MTSITLRATRRPSSTQEHRCSTSRLQLLDCLRAVACLAVIFSHAPGSYNGAVYGGYGVALFCSLSGFLITSLLLEEERKTSRIDYVAFLQRRALRILPIYFLVLGSITVCLKSGLFLKNHSDEVARLFSSIPALATFTLNNGGASVLNHFWSVSIEEQFYCCLPVLLLLVRHRTARACLLAVVAATLPFIFNTGVLGNIAFFPLAAGALMAVLNQRISDSTLRVPFNLMLTISLLLLYLSWQTGQCPYGPLSTISFVLLVWIASKKNQNLAALEPLAYVGRISYCMYLIHWPVITLVSFTLTPLHLNGNLLASFGSATAVSIALAAISWHLIEKPILGLRDIIRANRFGIIVSLISPILLIVGIAWKLSHG